MFRVYPGERGIYSIFTNQKIGYTYPTYLSPNYWDKYSLSVTPRDYIIPLKSNDNESYVKIKPDGSYTPIKKMWKETYGAGNFVINVVTKAGGLFDILHKTYFADLNEINKADHKGLPQMRIFKRYVD
ncbi:hypothetical protein PUR_34880 [Paenibacillus sp. URB8-2]|nr:hypothetical protein PUR_34880 [Paenibacillus sp. URB8-2]